MSNSSFQSTGTATLSGTTATNLTLSGTTTCTAATFVNPTISVASSTNGDMWYQAGGTVARLAKGTANHKLFQHASTGIPEWASGIKVYEGSINLATGSSDISYAGVGFKPSAIQVFCGTGNAQSMNGWGSSGQDNSCTGYKASVGFFYAADLIIFLTDGNNWSNSAVLKSMDSDGFTLTWTVVGSSIGTIVMSVLCFR